MQFHKESRDCSIGFLLSACPNLSPQVELGKGTIALRAIRQYFSLVFHYTIADVRGFGCVHIYVWRLEIRGVQQE